MYKTACGLREYGGWQIAPGDFWQMTPPEWWMLYDMNGGDQIKAERDKMSDIKALYFKNRGGDQ